MEWDVRTVVETRSTNADVAEAARGGATEGLVIVADHQTGGRGRLDRSWDSPPGSGLAMSVLLRPDRLPAAQWPWIPLMVGVAVADAVRSWGLGPSLKWPNDVELDGAKLAGILVERVESPAGPAAIVGVGLNVAMTADQLPVPTATSLALQDVDVDRDGARDAVLTALGERYALLQDDPAAVRQAYLAACGTVGSNVRVSLPDGSTVEGDVRDVDADGRLIVGGRAVTAGDVINVRT